MNTINIAIALNQNALYPAYVLLRSLARNHISDHICVYVLHNELKKEHCRFLEDALTRDMEHNQIFCIDIDKEKTEGLPYNHLWSIEMYYRLMLPELLGEQIDRILYLDVDMIVNKNISKFYFSDFGDSLMIVSKDMEFDKFLSLNAADSKIRNTFFKSLISKGMTYFCSGMLLMNLAKMKENYSFKKYREIFYTISDIIELPDQDLLNYVHFSQVRFTDEMNYGLFTQTAHELGMTYDYVRENVSILHFTGQSKPWTINLIRYDIEKIWWEYAKDSPFYWELLESVFYHSMESHFAEDKFHELIKENNELRKLIDKSQTVIQMLSNKL